MNKRIVVAGILTVCLAAGSSVSAKTNIGLNGWGAKLGYVSPQDIDGTLGFGAVVDLGTLTPTTTLEGEVLYWGKSQKESGAEFSYSQIYISGIAKYYFNKAKKGAKWLPYAGGGVGLVIGKAKVKYEGNEWFDGEDSSDSQTDLGIHLVGGMKYPIDAKKYAFFEARYSMDGADFFGIFGGIVFKLK
jgi:opacity protein-like surface antigen